MKNISDNELNRVNGGNAVGGICGQADSNTTINNCYNSGTITGNSGSSYAGGICGQADSNTTINNCYNSGSVEDESKHCGGLVGSI